jgi:hypothetical protein
MPVDNDLANSIWLRYQYIRDNGHLEYVAKAKRCEDFFAGKQWDATDLALLKAQRRPALTINKILSTVGNVMGEQIFNRTQIGFRPRKGEANQELADTLSKVFSQISDNNQLEWKRSDVFADGIVTSRGFFDVRLGFKDSLRGEVEIMQLNPKNVLVDPDAEEYDPDSWNDVFITKWMSADQIELLYNAKDAEELRGTNESFWPYGYDSIDRERDRFGDPRAISYGQSAMSIQQMRNIRVLERQYKRIEKVDHFANLRLGDLREVPASWDRERIAKYIEDNPDVTVIPKAIQRIRWTVIANRFVLHDDWSPYKHYTVVPYFPYFRRGRTVGLVENLLGPQELLNKVSSQELHVVNTTANSGWKIKQGGLKNMTTAELESRGAQSGIVLELDDVDSAERITPNQTPTGLDRISYKAEEHIKTISGVTDYRTGNAREDVSAKAVAKNQAASSATTAKIMDNLQRTDYILARNILDIVQEFYSEERIINVVTDRLLNQTEQLTVNQMTESGVLNDLTIGEYDVIVTTQPERDQMEDSQFDQAIALRENGIQIPDKFIIQSSRLKDKADIVKEMKQQADSPEAQADAELQRRGRAAEVSKLEAETQQKTADAQKKLNEAGQANDNNAEFVAKMKELEQEFALKKAQLDQEMALERQRFEQEMELERMKVQAKLAMEQELQEGKKRLQDAQVTATEAQAAATIKTADAKAEAMKKAPEAAAKGGAEGGKPATTGAKSDASK